MRRAAIAVAVMVAFVAVAPAVGAQCNPNCFRVMPYEDRVDDLLPSDRGDVDTISDEIPDTGDAGAVLP